VRSNSLPYKEEKFQRLMNTAEGSCGKLEGSMNMELELLEPQLVPLLTVWKYEDKAKEEIWQHRGLPIVHLLRASNSPFCSYFNTVPTLSPHHLVHFKKPAVPTKFSEVEGRSVCPEEHTFHLQFS
jgi:hypothetical protein